ncbi:hypothetical protein U6A24_12605 [Aquimarina gracilis]|uniref:Virion structural protein n=1 Tax=Aquimarina gracilis TaxID=874422 RepID=A0ABU5ZWQ9_9FLAO|nr:hypothetical protein [Aquimarina gracilis]MEB3346310.1 hypothetical protein [Aquimarina gracilis]
MEISFLINIDATRLGGLDGTQVTKANIIQIEDYKPVPTLDIPTIGEVFTGGRLADRKIYRNLIIVGSAQLLFGPRPLGYNSGLQHGLDVKDYVITKVKKTGAADGDPLGGGFHSVADVFGSKNILYTPNAIYFEGSEIDGIIESNVSYEFLLEYTTNAVEGAAGGGGDIIFNNPFGF